MDERIKNSALGKILQTAHQRFSDAMTPQLVHSFRKTAMPETGTGAPLQQGQSVASFPGYQEQAQRGGYAPPPSQFNFQQAGQMVGTAAGAIKNMFSEPPAPQGPKMWRQPTNEVIRQSDVPGATPYPSATPLPSPTSRPTVDPNFRFAYETLPRDKYWTDNGPRPGFKPNQPPANVGQLIREFFPNEATAAAAIFASENATFDPNRPDAENKDKKTGKVKSTDRGIPQINSDSFNGLMDRQGKKLKEQGITSYADMRDPRKSFIVAKMLQEGSKSYNKSLGNDSKGWSGWYGWQDTGYDINNGYFAAGPRGDYEENKKKLKVKKK